MCNPFAPEEIDNIEFSSTISMSVSGNAGVNFTFPIKIPITSISVNMTCSGGNGLSGSSSINCVNVSMTDLDGDGLADHVLRVPGFGTYWKRNISGLYGKLTKVNLPQGGNVEIDYAEQFGTIENPNFKYVLSKVTMNDGCNETLPAIEHGKHSMATSYKYEDGYYDRQKKDFFGFRIVKTMYADGTYQVDEYNTEEYYAKGSLNKSCSYAKDGALLSKSKTILRESPYAQPECEYSWIYEKSSGNSDFIHTATEYKYDEFGNCIEIKQNFGDGESLTGEIIYDNSNVADYIIGLPVDIYVYGTDGNLLRHRSGDYDEYGQLKLFFKLFVL